VSAKPVLLISAVLCLAACGGGGSDNNGGGTPPPPPPPATPPPAASTAPFWTQWGANPQHSGAVGVAGQNAARQLADITYDPFVPSAQTESGGALLTHYQAPIVNGNDVYMLVKTGNYTSCSPAGAWRNGAACGPNAWNSMVWNEARFTWINNVLTRVWTFQSDWKPIPNGTGLGGWEPVFHPVDANSSLYVPGASGTVWKVNQTSGTSSAHINPFASMSIVPANTYVAGPLTADGQGNIYYNVIEVAPGDPFVSDIAGAWLVKITSADTASVVPYATLVPNAPAAPATTCAGRFTSAATLPWPPSPTDVPPTTLCGSQRPSVNVAPAIAPDGTIYTVSRAHFNPRTTYLVAVNSDLSPKWPLPCRTC
jgi:hypothetical protein